MSGSHSGVADEILSGMWRRVSGRVVPDGPKDCSAFIFRADQSNKALESFETSDCKPSDVALYPEDFESSTEMFSSADRTAENGIKCLPAHCEACRYIS